MLCPNANSEVDIQYQVVHTYSTAKGYPEVELASTTSADDISSGLVLNTVTTLGISNGDDNKVMRNTRDSDSQGAYGLERNGYRENPRNDGDDGVDNGIDDVGLEKGFAKRNGSHGQNRGNGNNANSDTGRAGNHDFSRGGGGGGGGGQGDFHGQGDNGRNMHSKHVLTLTPQYVDLIPQGSTGFSISDRDSSVNYSSNWDLFVISPHTFHSTSQVGSSLRHSFNGTQIIVMGLLPSGNGSVSANYSIDGGPPQSNALEALSGTRSPVGNTTYFSSPVLPFANHTIDIAVTETGLGRNYTFDYFEIIISSEPSSSLHNDRKPSKAKAGVIAGAVIGALASIVCVVFLYWFWSHRFHRRKVSPQTSVTQSQAKVEYGINPYTYESKVMRHSNGKSITDLGRSPLGDANESPGSLALSRRSSLDVIHTSTSSGSETSSQTVVCICNGMRDQTHFPVISLSEKQNQSWGRHILV